MKNKVIAEFRRLFWAARREHIRNQPSAKATGAAHKKAVVYALAQELQWAKALLDASLLENQGKAQEALELLESSEKKMPETEKGYLLFLKGAALQKVDRLDDAIEAYNNAITDRNFDAPGIAWNNLGRALHEKGEYDEAIKAYNKALKDSKYDSPGIAWNNLGRALHEKGEYDEAIKAYNKALKDPKFDSPGITWSNMGLALYAKGEYDEAIKACNKALKDSKYDSPGIAWGNLGLALYEKDEYDEAIKAYNKALKDPKFDSPGIAWNNLGLALYKKGEYDEAIKAYNKALKDPKNDTPGYARFNLGLVYTDQGENQKAIDAYRRALEDPKFEKEEYWASKARSSIALLESGLSKESLSADDRALLESKPTTGRELTLEDRILGSMNSVGQSQYDKYLKKPESGRDDLISVLRGWSSAVPLLEGSERFCRGGGYFLKWKNKGIVIDPGLDFLQNFHDAKYHASEIHAVLISHNHPDHQADLKSIDDLRYQLYKLLDKKTREPYVLVWDADTQSAIKFPVEKPEHRFKPIVFDCGRGQTDCKLKDLHALPFSVDYFPVEHAEEVPNAVGFKIYLINRNGSALTVGYTGDTEFFEKLAEYLRGCDLLVAHISQPDREELQESSARKKRHLGYRGLIELINKCQPKATLVSEFWAGLGDLRISLVQAIRERTGNKAILPASIGMQIHLPGLEVECTQCAKKVPFEQVRVAPPAARFGNLSYLCESCMLGV
jgi:tetratricopeptide (TPR) repeat protein/ribonuclease BN (tRNA processing enzyme)